MYKKWFCSKKQYRYLKLQLSSLMFFIILGIWPFHNTGILKRCLRKVLVLRTFFFCSLFLLCDVLLFIPFVDCKKTIVKQFRVAHKNMHLAEQQSNIQSWQKSLLVCRKGVSLAFLQHTLSCVPLPTIECDLLYNHFLI